jgi:hypothetical protein
MEIPKKEKREKKGRMGVLSGLGSEDGQRCPLPTTFTRDYYVERPPSPFDVRVAGRFRLLASTLNLTGDIVTRHTAT